MGAKAAQELRQELRAGSGLELLDGLDQGEAMILLDALHAARARDQHALDQAIENSMTMVPLLLRGAFRKILFP